MGRFPDFPTPSVPEHFGRTHDCDLALGGGWRGQRHAIREGNARHVLNVFPVAWATQRGSMTGGPGEVHAAQSLKQNLEVPFGWFPQPVYFATIMRRHMLEFGTTEEQFGAVARRVPAPREPAPGRGHARPADGDGRLPRGPMLADPLRLFDSCLISDGGAAYVTTSAERARDLPQPPAVVLGVSEGFFGRNALGATTRVHQHAAGVQRAGRVRDGRAHAGRRRRAHRVRPVHRRVAHADRRHGVLPEGRGGRSSRATRCTTTREAAVQHHGGLLARVRARHRARGGVRETAPRHGARAGAQLRGRGLRRLHRAHGEHARAGEGRGGWRSAATTSRCPTSTTRSPRRSSPARRGASS